MEKENILNEIPNEKKNVSKSHLTSADFCLHVSSFSVSFLSYSSRINTIRSSVCFSFLDIRSSWEVVIPAWIEYFTNLVINSGTIINCDTRYF